MKVKVDPLKSSEYHQAEDLVEGVEYDVLAIEGDRFRVFSQEGPCRYPKSMFLITDSSIPEYWVKKSFDDSDEEKWESAWPVEFDYPGFFEDYFDNKPEAIRIFNAYIEKLGLKPELIVTEEGKLKRVR
ncbi:hypothetical protein COW36_21265 [bacterium (Candidatus Blackallbacteria) CG17_big_fil_post_rev_8_21_14_2_50_48_46]|uniref:Uncharacterized protein n=1 Tax=bacterium (Candidatus Blackallbacteria) CG17_big_fil_post_rev_8_21_14_2_50_48_46 TaxID=2014261 RepID=A0A2M7FYX1_9BACT|nr:MAG: hypothetical protein COW64_14575 [bacterium (Candidatus Blackallbacteria) CG18_big_fil_WC_8_21_14_2_50_49_26]PIW14570.1 MAG: hypothetical protein COW36_21265 [bacterium (Candidatus Blackallbacteria) CG17_big_fil_post_rev_8_21_14_2_50_48_46]PIW47255.1 MAG: hypothetical protein COW20_13710 [bacterium (Candidatus Blackallbacteria) CG13_big_fil_rev_8_21_14_2_50_49_14]